MNKKSLVVKKGEYKGMDSIGVVGPFDMIDNQISEIINELISKDKKNIVFDFSEMTYITSAGIGTLIKIFKNIQSIGGKLSIANATQETKDFLSLSSLDEFIAFV